MRVREINLGDGIRIHSTEEGNEGHETIVFLHGWPDSSYTFSRMLPLLASDFHSLAIDQRGFGDSDRPDCCYEIEDFTGDLLAFLDAMAIRKSTLVGHSFGTYVARSFALAHPERVNRLVLIASGLSSRSAPLLEASDFLKDVEDPLPLDFVREFQSGSAFAPIPPEFFESVVKESLKAPAWVWRQTLRGLLDYPRDEGKLESLETPTLLLWGDQDAVFPGREDQERLAGLFRNGTLRVYPQIGHCPNWECPEDVVSDLRHFMQTT